MRILITAGPTREPIDPVRYIGNRSSGRMGAAMAEAAVGAGHQVTIIVGPVSVPIASGVTRIDIQTAAQMHDAVIGRFPAHDLLIMAAAVADFRPIKISPDKLGRAGKLTIECEPTEDIVAAAAKSKRAGQRVVGFSLESSGNLERAREKLLRKNLDLIVYNPTKTMESTDIEAVLLWRNGHSQALASRGKLEFANVLLRHAIGLFDQALKHGNGNMGT